MKIALDMFFPLYFRYGIKMGLACVAAYVISFFIGSDYAVWASVASIIAMQINVAESMHAGFLRIGGTAIGALLGALLLYFLPPVSWFMMLIQVFGITAVCGYLARYTLMSAATAIAAVVVLIVGSQALSEGSANAIGFGLMRVTEIVIGVGCAFFVSLVFWPVRLVDTLRADLGMQFLESSRQFDAILRGFLKGTELPYDMLNSIEGKIWNNHERLSKARRHESFLYRYEHRVMNQQVMTLDRTAESLRSMLEVLNDYQEETVDPLIGNELRDLGDSIMATLRHMGGANPAAPAPDLVRGLTNGVGQVEEKLNKIKREEGALERFSLHKLLQIFAFYQGIRLLAESLLIALDRMQRKADK
ncbi:MAG: FUSC family protein [Desulfovibrio sp.]|nr:FUSC family protein [Desulfovibrio sp.]